MKTFYQSLFFATRFYLMLGGITMLFVLAYFFPALFPVALILISTLTFLVVLDIIFLFLGGATPLVITREMANRFSNGDDNNITVRLINNYRFNVNVTLLDELPFQFQQRDFTLKASLKPAEQQVLQYVLRPLERGEYAFGNTNAFIRSPLGLAQRRIISENEQIVKVYPSFIHLHNYQLFSMDNKMTDMGAHRKRMVGQSMEFDHIKEYVSGDDIRRLNWKATARRGNLMVNNYVEEKSQQVYCVIDKGRAMKMPFEGLTLLDYAVNASLVFSNIALQKGDKTGLVTMASNTIDVLPASNKKVQLNKILDSLYAQATQWEESDFEKLSVTLRSVFSQRSLLILFTNFESMSGLQRQLPYLRRLAKYHLLLVVFFENTELKRVIQDDVHSTEDIYRQVIAQKFAYEKKLMVRELTQYGIMSLLTTPQQLTMNVINKYLELKARSLI